MRKQRTKASPQGAGAAQQQQQQPPQQQQQQQPQQQQQQPSATAAAATAIAASNANRQRQLEERIQQALHAPLYLLRQSGPYAFVVCNDTLYEKFRVILGPQQCNCNRHHCVHLLFVMLRVLRVEPSDPILRHDVLRDFQVDGLIRRAEERYNMTRGHLREERPDELSKDECPICLLPLHSGAPLVRCTKGCGNRLHDKCMMVWAQERRRLSQTIWCPLCRADWEGDLPTEKQSVGRTNLLAELLDGDSGSLRKDVLPVVELPTPVQMDQLRPWRHFYDMRVISCILSKNWEGREAALLAMEKQLRALPESADSLAMLETTLTMMKTVVNDSVYKVYVSFLALFRYVYSSFIPTRVAMPAAAKQVHALLRPVVEDIMTRHSERAQSRFVTRTVDELLNMARDGHYGIAILAPMCIAMPSQTLALSWRWYLGRLELLLAALNEFLGEFAEALQDPEPLGELEKPLLEFLAASIDHEHDSVRECAAKLLQTVAEIARRSTTGMTTLRTFLTALKPMIRRTLDKRLLTVSSLALPQLPPVPAPAAPEAAPAPQLTCIERIAAEEQAEGRQPIPEPTPAAPIPSKNAPPTPDLLPSMAMLGKDVASPDCLRPRLVDQITVRDMALDKKRAPRDSPSIDEDDKASRLAKKLTNDLPAAPALSKGSPAVPLPTALPRLEGFNANSRWRRGPVLGIGASCTCYAVLNLRNGMLLAMKQIAFRRPTSPEEVKTLKQIEQELDVLKNLMHPHILKYYGCEWEENQLNMFLEHAAGGSLAALLRKYGPLPELVASCYTHQMLLALEYLHSHHIIHRDVKTANVLLDGNGVIKLADFGDSVRMAQLQTITGEFRSVRGTPAYMSPEAIRNEKRGRRCDVWSLGCVVLEMLTGRLPWLFYTDNGDLCSERNNPFSVMFKVASMTEPPRLPDFLSDIVVDFLLHCLSLDPHDRSHCSELLTHDFVAVMA